MSDSVLLQFHRWKSALLVRCKGLRDDRGSALVELGLTLAFLGVPIFMGTAHFSYLLIEEAIVANAAHVGAEYGMTSATHAGDPGSIIEAAARSDASGIGNNLSVTPSVFWACSANIAGTQYFSQSTATSACTGANGHALEFVKVIASVTITPAANAIGFTNAVTLSSTSIMEVEE